MATIDIRNLYGKIIHSVFVDQPRQLFPCDLRGLSLVNVDLTDADLPGSNLEGCILIGANLSGADLQRANLRNADLRYSNLKDADLRDADLSGAEVYPANVSKKTKFWGAVGIDPGSELATMAQAITTAKLRTANDVDECDVRQAQKETESFLSTKTKRLEKTVSRERRGWSQCENAVLKAKMRVLRYTREIELNRVRRGKDLRFLRKQGIDTNFIDKLLFEGEAR